MFNKQAVKMFFSFFLVMVAKMEKKASSIKTKKLILKH